MWRPIQILFMLLFSLLYACTTTKNNTDVCILQRLYSNEQKKIASVRDSLYYLPTLQKNVNVFNISKGSKTTKQSINRSEHINTILVIDGEIYYNVEGEKDSIKLSSADYSLAIDTTKKRIEIKTGGASVDFGDSSGGVILLDMGSRL